MTSAERGTAMPGAGQAVGLWWVASIRPVYHSRDSVSSQDLVKILITTSDSRKPHILTKS